MSIFDYISSYSSAFDADTTLNNGTEEVRIEEGKHGVHWGPGTGRGRKDGEGWDKKDGEGRDGTKRTENVGIL